MNVKIQNFVLDPQICLLFVYFSTSEREGFNSAAWSWPICYLGVGDREPGEAIPYTLVYTPL